MLVSSGLDSESAYGALCKSIDCQAFEGFARQLHKFSFKKKKKRTTIGHSKNPRTVRKRKILAGTSDRRTGEGDKRWASFTVFCIAKLYEQCRALVRMPRPDAPSLTQTLTSECKHCGASLGRHTPFSSMKTKSRPFEEMSSISGYLPSNARWRSEGKARPREDEIAVPPRALLNSFISTLRIRFLVLVVFSVRSSIFFEHCRKNSVNQRPLKSKAEVWTPIVDLLCVKDG